MDIGLQKRVSNDQNSSERNTVYLSPKDLAQRWACSRGTAQRIAEKNKFNKYFFGEGRHGIVRYILEDVVRFEETRRFSVSA